MRLEVNYVLESNILDPYFQSQLDEERTRLRNIDLRIREAVWDPSTNGAWESYWRESSSLVDECRVLQEGAFIRYGCGDDEKQAAHKAVSEAVIDLVGVYKRISALVAAMSHEFGRLTDTQPAVTVVSVPSIELVPAPKPIIYARGVEPWDVVPAGEAAES